MHNVIVSGASRGLGLGIARKLAADGYRVIAVARRESPELTAAMTEASPGEIHFRAFDLNAIDAIPGLVREIKTAFGPIYGLVNNAGLGTESLLSTMKRSQIEDLVRLNTIAPIILAQHAVRAMMTAGQGRVINMASIMASTGYSGLSVYGATKASMVGFTKSLAREVGKLGITVNAVAPGFIATEMTAGLDDEARAQVAGRSALKRLAEIEDVAAAVAYLMGETGRNITGTVMTVDAGGTA